MTYASPAWVSINKSNMYRLQVVQNRALRIIGGLSRHTRADKIHFGFEILVFKKYIKAFTETVHFCARPAEIGLSGRLD